MKKVKYLIVGIVFLVLLIVIIGIFFGKKSVQKKDAKSINDFENTVSKNEFIFLDNIGSYADVDYITDAKKGILDSIVIEMIVYKDEKSAKKVQDEQIKNFRTIKNTATTEHKDEGNNYYKFWMVSNGYYMVSSRIDNTLIFCKTLLENKEKVENILESMKY